MTTQYTNPEINNLTTTQLLDYEMCGSIGNRVHVGWACEDHNEEGVQAVLKPHAAVRNALWETGRYEWVRTLAVDDQGKFWVVC